MKQNDHGPGEGRGARYVLLLRPTCNHLKNARCN
jgi:hypothetical protein